MKIKILAIGKLKQSFWKEASSEYLKRINFFLPTEVLELLEEKNNNIKIVVEKEGARFLEKIKKENFVVVLDKGGKKLSSEKLAENFSRWQIEHKEIIFVIGGAFGLAPEILKRAHAIISLSDLTFTHEQARVILLEQLYRALTIINHKPYHY
jgi:23S rRNA (pseudouridine1915-N3)-methyltransferase